MLANMSLCQSLMNSPAVIIPLSPQMPEQMPHICPTLKFCTFSPGPTRSPTAPPATEFYTLQNPYLCFLFAKAVPPHKLKSLSLELNAVLVLIMSIGPALGLPLVAGQLKLW